MGTAPLFILAPFSKACLRVAASAKAGGTKGDLKSLSVSLYERERHHLVCEETLRFAQGDRRVSVILSVVKNLDCHTHPLQTGTGLETLPP